ncbi:DUF1501 domain-containing protein, partial [Rubripirellula sp.]
KKPLPESISQGQRVTAMTRGKEQLVVPSMFKFNQAGESGLRMSELLPHLSKQADRLCILKSLNTNAINHDPAKTFVCTGSEQPGKASMGAWLSYGLGAINKDLPDFIVLTSAFWTGGTRNVLQVVDGQCKLLMESAHSEIPNEEVTAEKSADRLPVPQALTVKDDPVVPMIERSIARYTKSNRTSDFDMLAGEFTPDGIQLVSNVAGPSRGFKEIVEASSVGIGDGSPYEQTVLEAKILGLRRIDDQLVAAYGVWSASTTDGELIDFGQWGNIFRQTDGEAKMVMESAGSFE